jgi:hypothetical protein
MIVSRSLFASDPLLDFADGIGQQVSTFRFDLLDGVTGEPLAELTPIRNASLSNNIQQTTKRRLQMALGQADTALVNAVNNRVDVTMILSDGSEWPLGRYVFMDFPKQVFSSGDVAVGALVDEMITVDQQITEPFNANQENTGLVIARALAEFNYPLEIAASPFTQIEAWGPGASRGQILEALATTGDYFSPWFGNDGKLHFIRSFDPADAVPNFNFDIGNQVLLPGITDNNDALIAPNRFVVIGNASVGIGTSTVYGVADVPDSAPHSIQNRGFVIPSVVTLPVTSNNQALAVAQSLAIQQTVAETVTLSTPIDPRHDSYDVIIWQDQKWLEIGWSMQLVAGGTMSHTLKKSYS